jgi:hypothetical protein
MSVKTDHKKHLAITFITGGAWISFWVIAHLLTCIRNTKLARVLSKKLDEADK